MKYSGHLLIHLLTIITILVIIDAYKNSTQINFLLLEYESTLKLSLVLNYIKNHIMHF